MSRLSKLEKISFVLMYLKFILFFPLIYYCFIGEAQVSIGPMVEASGYFYLKDTELGAIDFKASPNLGFGSVVQLDLGSKLFTTVSASVGTVNYNKVIDWSVLRFNDPSDPSPLLIEEVDTLIKQTNIRFVPSFYYTVYTSNVFRFSVGTGLVLQAIVNRKYFDEADNNLLTQNNEFYTDFQIGQLLTLNNSFVLSKKLNLLVNPFIGFFYNQVHQEPFKSSKPLNIGCNVTLLISLKSTPSSAGFLNR